MDTLIEVEHLVKSFALLDNVSLTKILRGKYERFVVLDDISFSVAEGEMLGVMGNNGEGKSTLLRVLAGVYGHDSGRIAVLGGIAAIFEMGTFMSMYHTGREYCKEYLYYMAPATADVDAIIEEIHEFTELEEFFDRPIHTYSSGMQAKLLFAVATSLPAEVFLIDEVLVVGDGYFQGKAWARVRQMLSQGTGGIIVTHDWQAVLKLCQSAMLLENHKVAYLGSALGMVRRYLGGRADIIRSEEVLIEDEAALLARTLEGKTGEDFTFSFDIRVNTPPAGGELGVYFYFEYFKVGVGWKTLFLCEHVQAITEPGLYQVDVCVPELPVAPGTYSAGVELVVPLGPGDKSFPKVYARLNWLNESPLAVHITGDGEKEDRTIWAGRAKWSTSNPASQ